MSVQSCIDVINMGCSKNLVDSELLARQLELAGYKVSFDPDKPKAKIVVINTCGFIGDAKEESIEEILKFVEAKKKKKIDKIFVMGCLAERYKKDLEQEIPEVDKYYGKFAWKEIIADLGHQYEKSCSVQHKLSTPSHYAYVKISEGCNRRCAYCAIPIITGKHISRPMEEIVSEVEWLVSQGVKEIQVIAQDLSYYGKDLYGEYSIAKLVEKISDVKGVEWIRLHYAYPTDFPYDLLRVMRERDNVCKYLDLAFQHIDDKVLKDMRRHITSEETYRLIQRIREEVPGIHLRTTLMVGFPGETETQFENLLAFVQKTRFERMGAFQYCEEEGTPAAKLKDDVSPEDKANRQERLMNLQEGIAEELNHSKIGQTYKVIIDRKEGDYYYGRTEFDSPEVDPEVLIPIENAELKIGNFYFVKIIDYEYFDLIGEIISE
ncbi:MAG: 30S ribosomal protein S12 methylthiotransferase RimO [Paludibacteraceae bacterium]|nr:30S ribosomal protein S12 methylthiotransferase RimO [Paludibacteraceae bacterium]